MVECTNIDPSDNQILESFKPYPLQQDQHLLGRVIDGESPRKVRMGPEYTGLEKLDAAEVEI